MSKLVSSRRESLQTTIAPPTPSETMAGWTWSPADRTRGVPSSIQRADTEWGRARRARATIPRAVARRRVIGDKLLPDDHNFLMQDLPAVLEAGEVETSGDTCACTAGSLPDRGMPA